MLQNPFRAVLTAGLHAALSLAGMSFATAAVVSPLSYDMPNGDGQAHGGVFNYWDKGYTGKGSATSDGALLSGGLGDLTDGVVAAQNWSLLENADGTGPYVGWRDKDPTIVFHFGERLRFSSITLHADDADGLGGVSAPGGVTVGGRTYTFADPPGAAPFAITVDGLDLVGSDLALTLHRRTDSPWAFVSEVSFTATAVPEPGHWALALGGLFAVAANGSRLRRGESLSSK